MADSICDPETEKDEIEASTGFLVYQILFILGYGALLVMCCYYLVTAWIKAKAISASNNKNQVIICLALGCLCRILSFIEVDCIYEETFRALKDVFFVSGFVLIVIFWIELQKFVRSMQSVQKLRPWLYGIMCVYVVFRVASAAADLFINSTMKNLFLGVCIIMYAVLMGLGLYYGVALLRKMGEMKRGDMKARLQKLTRFIVLENIILVIFMLAFLVRNGIFSKSKKDDPWLWWYLKLIEKILEYFSIMILCLTMTSRGKKQEDKKKTRGRPSIDPSKRARAGAALARSGSRSSSMSGTPGVQLLEKKAAAPAAAAAAAPTRSVLDGPWVKVKDPEDREYYFHAETSQRVWHVKSKTPIFMTLTEYKTSKASKETKEGSEVGHVNPLNVDIVIPRPPRGSP